MKYAGFWIIPILFGSLALLSCGGAGSGGGPSESSNIGDSDIPTYSVTLSWDANKETAVNSLGGGYKIIYARSAGFSAKSATVIDVPNQPNQSQRNNSKKC